jgi:outer membrane protein assembly factor BamB
MSPETGLATSWPAGGPKELWSFPLGEGFAGPAVRDGEVYILDRVNSAQDILRCLSLATGEELWKFTNDAPGEVSFNGSRTTPAVSENHIYAVGLMGDFYCLDRKTHQLVWHKKFEDEFSSAAPGHWGVAQSPSLYKNMVIVAPQGEDAFLAAYDQMTGNLLWKTAGFGGLGYSTPVVTTLDGVDQAVMVAGTSGGDSMVAGVSVEDGSILWTYKDWGCDIPIPYPVTLPDNRLFITGGYGAGSAMIQVTNTGGQFAIKELFKTDVTGSQIHQPLFYENHLYINSNGNRRSDGMLCLNLDGEMLWRTKDTKGLPRFDKGNLLMAEGLIVILEGKRGSLHLVDASHDGYSELASAEIFEGKQMWAPMALSQGKLVLRSQSEMKCLDLQNP